MSTDQERWASVLHWRRTGIKPRLCPCCGCAWSALVRLGKRTCCPTEQCEVQYRRDQKKAQRRRYGKNHVQRAKKAGVEYQHFDVLKVFERDGWRCKLCGKRTPRSLRGQLVDDAPELDHIVPLGAGGPHLMTNCQCSCRACNSVKGARPQGQTLLFG